MENNDKDKKYINAERKMKAAEDELNNLMQYPPFGEIDDGSDALDYDGVNPLWGFPSLSERGLQLQEAVRDAISLLNSQTKNVRFYDVDPSMIAKTYDGVFKEFADDLEEARLMEKRFPDSPIKALKSAKTK